MSRHVQLVVEGQVATIYLAREEALGALTPEMWVELDHTLSDLAERDEVRVVVVRSRNPRVFSPGLDLNVLGALSGDELRRALKAEEAALYRLENLPIPTVAAVAGWVLGAGCGLAVACDVRIADETARFGLPVARLGLMTSPAMLQRFVAVIGPARTKELLFRGRAITAQQAEQWGLVNQVVPAGQLDAAVREWIRDIRRGAPAAIRAGKRAVNLCLPLTVSHGMPPAPPYFIEPAEFREGLAAFREHREPDWGFLVARQREEGALHDG